MIGIHVSKAGFSDRWISYCQQKNIPYKIVDCYKSDIMEQLKSCSALMWHIDQSNPKDILFAKQLLYSVEFIGKKVFPDFNTMWHFDDKVGQKYLLEALDIPLVPSYVFYTSKEALEWIELTEFPKVLKLRGGAGSANVKLVRNRSEARRWIKKAFGVGIRNYRPIDSLMERYRLFKLGKNNFITVLKGLGRIFVPPEYAQISGRAKGYIYFQDFIPGNDSDIRVVVIDGKAFAIKRMVRKNDFRASGSGHVYYNRELFDEEVIRLAFHVASKLQSQCVAIDFIFDNGTPLVVEISYGFIKQVYYPCEGYWDESLNWHDGEFNSQAWMIDSLLKNS